LDHPPGDDAEGQDKDNVPIDMEVKRQFTFLPEGTRKAETDFKINVITSRVKNRNSSMQSSMQKICGHTRMQAIVVMQDASRTLSRRQTLNEIVGKEKLVAESGVGSKKTRELWDPHQLKYLELPGNVG
jgi:hypothetical protein